MKLELLILIGTVFFIMNVYHDGKYLTMIKSWKKYYQMAFYGFLGLSLFVFIRKYPVTCAYAAWVEGLVIGSIVYGVMGCEWAF